MTEYRIHTSRYGQAKYSFITLGFRLALIAPPPYKTARAPAPGHAGGLLLEGAPASAPATAHTAKKAA